LSGTGGTSRTSAQAASIPKDKSATLTDKGGFVTEFLAYLRARKWLWLFPIVVISLLLILMAALLFGPDVALETLYQIF
jgi:uncharacterized protein DUF5989